MTKEEILEYLKISIMKDLTNRIEIIQNGIILYLQDNTKVLIECVEL